MLIADLKPGLFVRRCNNSGSFVRSRINTAPRMGVLLSAELHAIRGKRNGALVRWHPNGPTEIIAAWRLELVPGMEAIDATVIETRVEPNGQTGFRFDIPPPERYRPKPEPRTRRRRDPQPSFLEP